MPGQAVILREERRAELQNASAPVSPQNFSEPFTRLLNSFTVDST